MPVPNSPRESAQGECSPVVRPTVCWRSEPGPDAVAKSVIIPPPMQLDVVQASARRRYPLSGRARSPLRRTCKHSGSIAAEHSVGARGSAYGHTGRYARPHSGTDHSWSPNAATCRNPIGCSYRAILSARYGGDCRAIARPAQQTATAYHESWCLFLTLAANWKAIINRPLALRVTVASHRTWSICLSILRR